MKTLTIAIALLTAVVAAVPAAAIEVPVEVEVRPLDPAEVKSLGEVRWNRPEIFSGRDFVVIFTPNGSAVCREVVAGNCIPVFPFGGTAGEMLRNNGQKFPVVLPRIGDF